jgi:acyl carrier protein
MQTSAPDEELITCFQSVFPFLSEEQIRTLRKDELTEWDSLASLSLITVIEEEFDLRLDDDTVERLDSFAGTRAVVAQLIASR